MITKFVLNSVLDHVSILCVIEKNQQLEYDIDKDNPDWITDGPWLNTSICKKYTEQCLEVYYKYKN